jgi:ABC-2 type transport system permease protein
MVYCFWWAVTGNRKEVFGWQESQILTYILGVAFLRSLILSSRTIDVGGEINQGNLTNYLLKPLSFIKFWFSKDLADKCLNVFCSVTELAIFLLIIKPHLVFQSNPSLLFLFFVSVIISTVLYFYINFFLGLITFWTPESWSGTWGPRFVFTIILEFLAGTMFPLDILPRQLVAVINFTPFPYLIYFPLNIYLGKIAGYQIIVGLVFSLFWLGIWYLIVDKVWRAGLKVYAAEGR